MHLVTLFYFIFLRKIVIKEPQEGELFYIENLHIGDVVLIKGEYGGWFKGCVYPDETKGFFHSSLVIIFDDSKKNLYEFAKRDAKKKLNIDHEKEKQSELVPKDESWWKDELSHETSSLSAEILDLIREWGSYFRDKFLKVKSFFLKIKKIG